MWLLAPGRIPIPAHTSVSGPYCVFERQPVQVVVLLLASWLETTLRQPSGVPLTPVAPDQRPESETGNSSGRLKSSRVGSGWTGATRSLGVACASFESGPSPSAFSADTL